MVREPPPLWLLTDASIVMIRVLYLHGLSESASSPKWSNLVGSAELDVVVLDLKIQLFPPRWNSVVSHLLRGQRVLIACVVCIALAALFAAPSATMRCVELGAALACGGYVSYRRKSLVESAIAKAFDASLRVAEEELHRANRDGPAYDVLVGFSWGGALACELLRRKAWSGPTLLLGPAHQLLLEKRGRWSNGGDDAPAAAPHTTRSRSRTGSHIEGQMGVLPIDLGLEPKVAARCYAVQARDDTVVNPEHTRNLCTRNSIELYDFAGAHNLWLLCDGERLRTAVKEVAREAETLSLRRSASSSPAASR